MNPSTVTIYYYYLALISSTIRNSIRIAVMKIQQAWGKDSRLEINENLKKFGGKMKDKNPEDGHAFF